MAWYTGDAWFDTWLAIGFLLAALTAAASRFVPAPYGRFASRGPAVPARLGWMLMELPAVVSFGVFFALSPRPYGPTQWVFLAVWLIHYANRGFVGPWLMRVPRGARSTFGWSVLGSGILVTSLHGYLHATFVTVHGAHLTAAWLTDPRFVVGIGLYYASFALNVHSDAVLRRLRTPAEVAAGERVYRIPYGGAHRWVSCPSYLSELLMWSALALATWSLPTVWILAISAANLVPRAAATHRWYREKFPDYPAGRRALIPFVW